MTDLQTCMPPMQNPPTHRYSGYQPTPQDACISLAKLDINHANLFLYLPEKKQLDQMEQDIGDIKIDWLKFKGSIKKYADGEWHLKGTIDATITQHCVVSLEPIKCDIHAQILRQYVNDLKLINSKDSGEIPDDDNYELLTDNVNLQQIARESLLLEMPTYPRKPNLKPVDLKSDGSDQEFIQRGKQKPFAKLKKLKNELNWTKSEASK